MARLTDFHRQHTPKRWTMSVKNVTACFALRFVMGSNSTHLENLSIATNKWVKPLGAFRRGPTMPAPTRRKAMLWGWSAGREQEGWICGHRTGTLHRCARSRWHPRPRWASKILGGTHCLRGCGARRGGRRSPRECPGGARAPWGWARITAGCRRQRVCTALRRRGQKTWPSWRCAWPRTGPRGVPLRPSRRYTCRANLP
jgi:hypothetical protein